MEVNGAMDTLGWYAHLETASQVTSPSRFCSRVGLRANPLLARFSLTLASIVLSKRLQDVHLLESPGIKAESTCPHMLRPGWGNPDRTVRL